MTLRPYQPGDFNAMFALDERCFAPAFRFSKAAMRRFAENKRARTLLSEENGALLAFAILHLEQSGSTRVAYIVTLDVAPEHRRTGLARRLMQALEEQARNEGIALMLLHVSTENTGAIRFYEALGYTPAHTEENFYGEALHALVYRKPLT